MNELVKKSAQLHFDSNPNAEKYHVTKDGQCFENWHDANEHSKTLGSTSEDREIVEVKRSDLEKTEIEKPKKGK